MFLATVFSIFAALFAALPAVIFAAPIHADESGFKPLFNGKDLEGWEGATNTYCVTSDGLLTCRQGSRGGKTPSATFGRQRTTPTLSFGSR